MDVFLERGDSWAMFFMSSYTGGEAVGAVGGGVVALGNGFAGGSGREAFINRHGQSYPFYVCYQ